MALDKDDCSALHESRLGCRLLMRSRPQQNQHAERRTARVPPILIHIGV